MIAPVVLGATIVAIINKLFDIMQTVSFMMFIEEEGIQIRGFGIMSLIREKLVDDVTAQLDEMKVHTRNLETLVDKWGWIAPYMQPTYRRYVQATWDQIDAWEAWVISVKADTPKFGIRIQSSPSSAKIEVDSADTGLLTPQTLLDLTEGWHRIKLTRQSSRDGVFQFNTLVYINKNIIQEVLWELLPKQGKIRIHSSPSAAEIWINGVDTGFLTPHTFILNPGVHRFNLEYNSSTRGTLRYETQHNITAGYDKEFRWILED